MNITSVQIYFDNGSSTLITSGGEARDFFGKVINLAQPKALTGAEIAANPKLVENQGNDPTLMGVPTAFEYNDAWYYPTAYQDGRWSSWYRGLGSEAQPEIALAWMAQQLKAPLTLDRSKYGNDQKQRMGW